MIKDENKKSGILLVDKTDGISSFQLINKIKKILNLKKIGHTGTLDPFATGLLICVVGKATKLSNFFLKKNKKYTAQIFLGAKTDTLDKTGRIIEKKSIEFLENKNRNFFETFLKNFEGKQKQEPPFFSAIKHQGKPLYKLARQGKFIKKEKRDINIFYIKLLNLNLPYLEIETFVSSGTYIRTLASDIGEKLGCGAYLENLRRIEVGSFSVQNAYAIDDIENKKDKINLINENIALKDIPEIEVSQSLTSKIKFGQVLSIQDLNNENIEDGFIRLVNDQNNLLALINKNKDKISYFCNFM